MTRKLTKQEWVEFRDGLVRARDWIEADMIGDKAYAFWFAYALYVARVPGDPRGTRAFKWWRKRADVKDIPAIRAMWQNSIDNANREIERARK